MIVAILVIPAIIVNGKTTGKVDSFKDSGPYVSGSKDWPYYGKTPNEFIHDLNKEFSYHPENPANEKKLYKKVGIMYLDKDHTNSRRRHYDVLEVPISVDCIYDNGVWYYGTFTKERVKLNDPGLQK